MYVADSRASTPTASVEGTARPATAGRYRSTIAPTVLALGTVSLVTDVSSEMVTAVLPLYLVTGLGLSPLGFGLLDGVYNGFSAVVRLVGGHLADRGGGRHKWVAGAGYALSALCKPLLLVAHTLTPIGLILAADRTGKGLRTAPRDALISLSSTPESRGRAFGVHRAMDTAGALLGPLAAFLILRATVDGYDAVFTVSFCVAVLGVLVLVLFVPGGRSGTSVPGERSRTAAVEARPTLRAALGLLSDRGLRRVTVCALLLGLATVSDSFVYLLLQRRLGVPDGWFPLLPLGTAAAFLLLAVPLGRLADRWGRWRVFLAGHGALLLAYALLLTSWHGTGLPYAVLALHGTFYAATDGVLMAVASDSVPEALRSSGLALVQTGQAGARFACSLAFGAAWTLWGDRTALLVSTAALAVCAAYALTFRPSRETAV
ncbi:Na+/melibiose symporter-like transporter [Streptomyces sp. Ag109_O5-1]|uniref:MFS transporter n=1 Tax=Streptomyces sp. Ag109_O5-1 TaxID=1938851 RepID=UPI000F4D902E|nr:MFS transporter [Streptomyces sp. Ag109_O5-1]RPE44482.1 Na+/melibiose symporter-like transporter [Streptomyces sp. Ag109_O5-1]